MSSAERCGDYYWAVLTQTPQGAVDGLIHLFAQSAAVEPSGALVFRNKHKEINISFASGIWRYFYAASCLTGDAVAVEHWNSVKTRAEE